MPADQAGVEPDPVVGPFRRRGALDLDGSEGQADLLPVPLGEQVGRSPVQFDDEVLLERLDPPAGAAEMAQIMIAERVGDQRYRYGGLVELLEIATELRPVEAREQRIGACGVGPRSAGNPPPQDPSSGTGQLDQGRSVGDGLGV